MNKHATRFLCPAILAGLTLLACAGEGAAQTTNPHPWRVTIAPYAWLTSMDGNLTVKGVKADADADFYDDILGDLSVAGMILAEVQRDRLAFGVNFVGARLESSNNNIDTTQDSVNLALSATYFLVDKPRSADGGIGYRLGPLAGLRYTYIRAEVDLGNFRTVDSNEDWVDPFVGARGALDLSERWGLVAEADIGGFGVGSDISWNAQAYAGYKTSVFGLRTSLALGYRAMHQDYDHGDFKYDVTTYGPIIGAVFTF